MATTERVCLMVSDAIVVAVTIYHTYGTIRTSREANVPAQFSITLLRAGQSSYIGRSRFMILIIVLITRYTIFRVRSIVVYYAQRESLIRISFFT